MITGNWKSVRWSVIGNLLIMFIVLIILLATYFILVEEEENEPYKSKISDFEILKRTGRYIDPSR